eukprot:TRINITY_DN17923_c0_g1_i1.p1 TRINITY_DN17923_c0_g1~~TRINITY_DN17923_c0_g1_i1.p1  ORF type:complete len:480 (+),score=66.96 TRINITY_DN17923_c0_g1_i1:62-1441(+)
MARHKHIGRLLTGVAWVLLFASIGVIVYCYTFTLELENAPLVVQERENQHSTRIPSPVPENSTQEENENEIFTIGAALKSGGNVLSGKLFWNAKNCEGSIQLSRTQCDTKWDSGARITDNKQLDHLLKNQIGPDHYRITVETANEIMSPTDYKIETDRCVLTAPITLLRTTPTITAKITVKWETDHFNGVTETVKTITSFREKYLVKGYEVQLKCSGDAKTPLSHRYTKRKPKPLQNVKAGEWEWVSTSPASPPPSCKQKSLLFIGDSQIRTVWRHYEAAWEGTTPVLTKTSESDRVLSGGHRVMFTFNPLLTDLLENGSRYLFKGSTDFPDYAVVGFGPWPANMGWTHERFFKYTEDLFRRINASREGSPTKYIWAGSPAWPKPRRNSEGFRITNSRLRLWNTHTARLAARYGIPTIDFYAISLPFQHLHRGDGMHYDNSVVLYTMVEEVRRLACDGV